MPTFGDTSKRNLAQAHPELQRLFNEVVQTIDCSLLCGYRGKEEQEAAFKDGKSRLHFPNSKHNHLPSLAVDAVPYPMDWKDLNRFYFFAGFVTATAKRLGIKIRWGGDWNGNFDFKDENFHDLPHFELAE